MPRTKRAELIAATPADVWATVGDPHHFPRWWPRVERVEAVQDDRFTEVLRTEKGSSIRADFRIVERVQHERLDFEQEVEGTPFERILEFAGTTIALRPADGGTEVTIQLAQKLRGVARLGGFMIRRANRRQIDEALAGLVKLHAG